ncbi:hypothetical protein BGZ60DRAFT_366852 [Tricladium varicosporioides]|nr:hypothetical protein BGZ60DRAFT_366852 [Hymenoscyphus varicosporioides]
MCAPLYDDKGAVRYFIGAQIDVTGLIEEGMGIESFRALLHHDKIEAEKAAAPPEQQFQYNDSYHSKQARETLERLTELSMMFSQDESDVVNRNSRNSDDSTDASSIRSGVPTSIKNRSQAKRVIGGEESLGDGLNLSQLNLSGVNSSGCSLPGVYKHYILVRPHPSLQICFVSPSLRLPGILRTHLFSKLGGPSQTISALEKAFQDGASVTAKVLWLPKNSGVDHGRTTAEAKPRWMRCTPLLGSDDRVGVWMIILVPVDGENSHRRREHISTLVDEVEVDRKRYVASSVRSASRAGSIRTKASIDRDAGVYGLPSTLPRSGRQRGRGRADDPNLYAEYLRSSSPSSRNGRIG